MAVRLPVILSQPARRDASATDLVESLVAATLMLPGLDANLIGDIGTIELGSTDHVCLLGHSRDLVLASFLELGQARAAWQRLGQSGFFVDLAQDEADIRASLRGAIAGRKVFYFQLALGQPVDRLLDRCRELLAAQQVSLVTLQLRPNGNHGNSNGSINGNGNGNGNGNAPALAAKPAGAVVPSTRSLPLMPEAGGAPLANRAESLANRGQLSHSSFSRAGQAESDEHEEWSALDKLVDDLDAMDL